ncbi:putative basic amino acid antiporter YfcC [Permianibacter sp. IMCC34836]|uniref:putative basic amino acid antiporter YfcC n=1 Tax=Permianibacter fluminis TaxID=2738515 RepID=UPI0015571726|nr:putative basic amino acid antiporter YfcC [Permianibacter fluminis]NQD35908.1 putative basic amino acid antiporter YfcC [Permianibacter fluminis]
MQNPNAVSTWRMPDTLLIVFAVLLLAALMTVLIPRGQFQVAPSATSSKPVVVPGSFHYSDDGHAQGVAIFSGNEQPGVLNALFDGLTSGTKHGAAIGVVMFILIVGGAFGIILKTGAMDEAFKRLACSMRSYGWVLLPVFMFFFSFGGAVFGMGEEAMAFAVFIIPLMRTLGFDAVTGVLITYGATQVGFATSWMNPFSVVIAQGVAGLPVMSGTGFRFVMWLVFTVVFMAWVLRYALRHRDQSVTANVDIEHAFNSRHGLILLVFVLGMCWVVWGVTAHGYYLREIATQFLAIALLCAVIARFGKLPGCSANELAEAFKTGAAQLLPAAIVVGIAQGIMILLGGVDPTQPSVVNTMLQAAADLIGDAPSWLAAQGMLVFQSVFNFFVTSGSAQAALTMPLMAPLADLVGVSRQTAVLAFQLGDGLAHLIYPTSAALMGTLAVAKVPFVQWLRTIWSLQLLMAALSLMAVAVAVLTRF